LVMSFREIWEYVGSGREVELGDSVGEGLERVEVVGNGLGQREEHGVDELGGSVGVSLRSRGGA